MNNISLMGRLTKKPELRKTPNGVPVASFSIAVKRDFQDTTDFIDCVAWRQSGEFVSKYFDKGDMIAVTGSLQIRTWTDDEGNKRKASEVVVQHTYFTGSKTNGNTSNEGCNEYTTIDDETATDDEYDLPF